MELFRHTVPLFMVALIVGLAGMPRDVYAFNQRGLGIDHAAPWRASAAEVLDRAVGRFESLFQRVRALWTDQKGEAAADLLVPTPIGNRLRSLRQEREELKAEHRELLGRAAAENRAPTKDENTLDDKLAARHDALNEEIKRYERLIESDRASVPDKSAGGHNGTAAAGPIRSFGEFLQAVACASSPTLRGSMPNGRELIDRLSAYSAASGMSVGTPADGGYLVRKDWTSALLDKARAEAVLFPRCRAIEIGGDFDGLEYPYIDESSRVDGSRWGGVQVFWKAEAAAVTAKQPKIGRGELRLEEIMGLAYTTERLLRDATALQGLLSDGFSSEFSFKIDDSILRGNGAGQMLGILNSPALVTQAAEGAQTADTVNVDNVLKMYARMPARLKPGAAWFIHSDVMTQLPKMVIGQMPVWVPPGGLNNLPYGLLLGKPVIEIEQASAIGDVGDIIFANLSEYVVIRKASEGLRADVSMHVRFLNDEQTFRWVYRVNGQPISRTALTPFKGSNTLSAFVTLAAR